MSEVREIFLCDCGEHGVVITDIKEIKDAKKLGERLLELAK